MPPRLSVPGRDRDYDYSNVGKVGRRTGVTLAPRPVDEHGLEEITGLFSSPRKPSPAGKRQTIVESIETPDDATTPQAHSRSQAQTPRTVNSVRRSIHGSSHPPPRSASPRKSGITGTARRNGAMDVLANNQLQQELREDIQDRGSDTQLSATPQQVLNARAASARPATIAKRFSPDRTPLRNRVLNQRAAKSAVIGRVSDVHSLLQDMSTIELPEETPSRVQLDPVQQQQEESILVSIMGNDDDQETSAMGVVQERPSPGYEAESELPDPPHVLNDNSDDDQTFEPPTKATNRRSVPNKANSRRKRKSDAIEDADTAAAVSSPAAKKAKRRSNETRQTSPPESAAKQKKAPRGKTDAQDKSKPSKSSAGRKPLAKKDANTKLSSQRQQELDDVVEKIKARPSAPKSLYILRRETPADESVTHTRSGRISVKPLAWWRNEHCVYSGTPGRFSAGVEDGARFPLNSIKEIVRTENVPENTRNHSRKSKTSKRKGKGKNKARGSGESEDDTDLDLASDNDNIDPDADDWEFASGTLKGPIASWDAEHQIGVSEETVDIEIAHAHAAIQTKDVKTDTFKYAKLLNTRFFGAGVVDLPAGGRKSAKNSRKMHMCFFVVQGRVTVQVGVQDTQDGEDGEWGTRFSIGKGGFWQVPRGNHYAIQNEHGKAARIFFSQGCEPAPGD